MSLSTNAATKGGSGVWLYAGGQAGMAKRMAVARRDLPYRARYKEARSWSENDPMCRSKNACSARRTRMATYHEL